MTDLSKNQLKQLAKLKQKKYRDQSGQYIISGQNAVKTSLDGPALKALFLLVEKEQLALLDALSLPVNLPVYTVSAKDFKQISDEQTPQGLALVAEKPVSDSDAVCGSEPLLLYLDRISDPGNLGTIIRTARWFGLQTILLSPGSADPYQPKVVRSSTGLVSHMKIIENVDPVRLSELKKENHYSLAGTIVYGGENPAETVSEPRSRRILLLGSEARGLSPELAALCDRLYTIPKPGYGESLNLATSAAIFLYQWQANAG